MKTETKAQHCKERKKTETQLRTTRGGGGGGGGGGYKRGRQG